MTTYRAIAATETDPEAPITSALMKALAGNVLAIAEGDATAPKIYGAAMFGPNAGAVVLRNCLPVGNRVTTSPSGGGSTGPFVVEPVVESFFTAMVACTIQLKVTCTIVAGTSSGTASLVVYKNGVAVQTYTTNQTGTTLNITLAAGDNVGIISNARGGTSSASTVTLSLLQYCVDIRSAVMT